MDIRARILQICNEKNISVNEIALLAQLTQSTLNNITSGRNKSVTISTIEQICNGIDMTLAEFFEPTKRPKFPPEALKELAEFEKHLIKKYKLDEK